MYIDTYCQTNKKRFDSNKTLPPGPGAYNEARTAFESLSKLHGIKKTPFSVGSTRFDALDSVYANQAKTRSAPGPGQYRINGFAEDTMKRALIESRRRPAFGQSSVRKLDLNTKDDALAPGPALYKPLDQQSAYKSKKENHSSTFASTTKQRHSYFIDVCSLLSLSLVVSFVVHIPTLVNIHSRLDILEMVCVCVIGHAGADGLRRAALVRLLGERASQGAA